MFQKKKSKKLTNQSCLLFEQARKAEKMNRAICVICLDDLWAPDKQVVSYSCGHVHHAGCVQRIT